MRVRLPGKSPQPFILLAVLACSACQRTTPPRSEPLLVHHTPTPIQLDGRVDKPVWQQVEPVRFEIPRELQRQGQSLEEGGTARVLWDDQYLYIAFDFVDSDVVALGKEDDLEQHQLGDVAEIFLKPTEQTWYWEFHVTPAGQASTYWHVGRGRFGMQNPDGHVKPRFFQLAVQVQGTLNDWHDRDRGWTAEVAIPFDKLDRFHERANPRENWMILLSRYNYTRYRVQATGPELSSWPVLSKPSFHLVEEYAPLKLVP
jgi:hypothetical protein